MIEVLHRLVYYIRNRVTGGSEALAKAITSILAASEVNNGTRRACKQLLSDDKNPRAAFKLLTEF